MHVVRAGGGVGVNYQSRPTFVYSDSAARSKYALSGTVPSAYNFYATCHPGLEQVVADELTSERIGAHNVRHGKAGVSFSGDSLAVGYSANLWLRAAIRVVALLAEGSLERGLGQGKRGADALYDLVYAAVPWHQVIPPGATFSVEPRLWSCTDLRSAAIAWTAIKDAVCDAIRDARGSKPAPPAPGAVADVPLYVTLYNDQVQLFRDMSGASLHKRGYRGSVIHKAALNEAAAAGVLMLAGWPQACAAGDEAPLVLADPMCGSGTLLVEAALMALDHAPGLYRRSWPFLTWPDFDSAIWRACLQQAAGGSMLVASRRAARSGGNANGSGSGATAGGGGVRAMAKPLRHLQLLGNDRHAGALRIAATDAATAGVSDLLALHHGDCGAWVPAARPSMVVSNPPWGQRLGDSAGQNAHAERGYDTRDVRGGSGGSSGGSAADGDEASSSSSPEGIQAAWASLSAFLKGHCSQADAYLVCGNPEVTRSLRMKAERRIPITMGGIDVRLLKYHVLPPLPTSRQPRPADAAAISGRAAADGRA